MAVSCSLSLSAALPRLGVSSSGQESTSSSRDRCCLGSSAHLQNAKVLLRTAKQQKMSRKSPRRAPTALLGGSLNPETLQTLGKSLQEVLAGSSGGIPAAVSSTGAQLEALVSGLLAQLPGGLPAAVSSTGAQLEALTSGLLAHLPGGISAALNDTAVQIGSYSGAFSTFLGEKGVQLSASELQALAATGTAAAVLTSAAADRSKVKDSLPLRYDPVAIAAYFEKRPLEVAARSTFVLARVSQLVSAVLLDRRTGREALNEKLRARQLRELITDLGPTAIKVGQALSIRPDLLSLAYLEELQTLQDRVPPFSNDEARKLIEEGLGRPLDLLFSDFSPQPIAAASLGQVYKARTAGTGDLVAVKVQRPGVLEDICLDLYVLRMAAKVFQRLPNIHSDLIAVLDNWAGRFFDELDYVQEGMNAIRFAEDMKGLANVIVADVYPEYTSRRVLTTAWVEGEKLSESTAEDVGPLVTTMLNCYLIQLLESGFLHADPHPGNLLRTPEGKLCVLDFGLMTEVTEDQRYALIEYISHLVNSDYEKVAEDLVVLGFVPPELVDPEKTRAVVPQLSRVLGELVKGGGAKKINVNQVTADLSALADDYVFVIPPYFALILRAFGVLEGIGLAADPDYAIVDECYPYLAKRLLTDDHPRSRDALKYFLYGRGDFVNVERIEELANGFQTFRQLMTPVGPPQTAAQQRKRREGLDPAAQQALSVIFARDGSFLQDLLLTELVRTVDALSRESLATFWRVIGFPAAIPVALLTPPPLRTLPPPPLPGTWPIPLPGAVFGGWGALGVAKLSEEDEKALSVVRRIWQLLEPQLRSQGAAGGVAEVAQDLLPVLRSLAPGVSSVARRFLILLLQRQAQRLADDLENAARYQPVVGSESPRQTRAQL